MEQKDWDKIEQSDVFGISAYEAIQKNETEKYQKKMLNVIHERGVEIFKSVMISLGVPQKIHQTIIHCIEKNNQYSLQFS